MNPAVGLPIPCPVKEWAVMQGFAGIINPEPDPGYTQQVSGSDPGRRSLRAVSEPDSDVPEDIFAFAAYPEFEIISRAFLVPSPFLAALPTLQTVLVFRHSLSHVILGQEIFWIFCYGLIFRPGTRYHYCQIRKGKEIGVSSDNYTSRITSRL